MHNSNNLPNESLGYETPEVIFLCQSSKSVGRHSLVFEKAEDFGLTQRVLETDMGTAALGTIFG